MKYFKYTILLFLVGLSACDMGNDPEPGGTAVQAVTGEWFTTFTVNGVDVYNLGYQLITTSNTAANSADEFLITDRLPNGYSQYAYKLKTPLNLDDKTFGGTGLVNLVYDITATITDGKIISKAVNLPSGIVADSIHFNIEFSDDPGTIYTVGGYRRTGFQEDEH